LAVQSADPSFEHLARLKRPDFGGGGDTTAFDEQHHMAVGPKL
jgi:hypothetical protein